MKKEHLYITLIVILVSGILLVGPAAAPAAGTCLKCGDKQCGQSTCIGMNVYQCQNGQWYLTAENSPECGYKPPAPASVCTDGQTKSVGSCPYACSGNAWFPAGPCTVPAGDENIRILSLDHSEAVESGSTSGPYPNLVGCSDEVPFNPPARVTLLEGSLSGGITFSSYQKMGPVTSSGGAPTGGMVHIFYTKSGQFIEDYITLPFHTPVTRTGVSKMVLCVRGAIPRVGMGNEEQPGSYAWDGLATVLYSVG
jgi:hypothetical protein